MVFNVQKYFLKGYFAGIDDFICCNQHFAVSNVGVKDYFTTCIQIALGFSEFCWIFSDIYTVNRVDEDRLPFLYCDCGLIGNRSNLMRTLYLDE